MPNSCKSGKKHTKSCNRNCSTAQKVVIPKGMINPEETTIIEIPCILHKQPVVIAKRKDMLSSSSRGEDTMGSRSPRLCKSPKPSTGSFSSFHSASLQQEDQYEYGAPPTTDEDNGNINAAGGEENRKGNCKCCKKSERSFSPDVHSTALPEPFEEQNDFESSSTPEPNTILKVDATCEEQISPARSRSPTSSIRSCNSPRRSSIMKQGCQSGTTSPNAMQQLANTLQGDPNMTLDETEEQERMQLQRDLDAFQKARRQLIERTTKFANQLPTGDFYDAFSHGNYSGRGSSAGRGNTMIDPRFDQKEYARQLYNTII